MRQQMQAESNLQVQSQQLTHYLNDWLIQDIGRNGVKSKGSIICGKRVERQDKNNVMIFRDKQLKEKDKQKDKAEVCRIEFPIIQERSKSSKDLMLPLIRPRNNPKVEQRRVRLRGGHSQQKLSYTPASLIFKNGLVSSGSTETYQKQMIRKLKRKRKRSPNGGRNPENERDKPVELDVTEIKAMLMKQLKNNRRSACKDKDGNPNFRSHKDPHQHH